MLAVIALVAIAYQVIAGAWPAISRFGLGFLAARDWQPNFDIFGAGHAALRHGGQRRSMALPGRVPIGIAIGLYLSHARAARACAA